MDCQTRTPITYQIEVVHVNSNSYGLQIAIFYCHGMRKQEWDGERVVLTKDEGC